ncbi:hypothetical protein TOL_1734 [Thalassolituus oleivorans MIL-1]|uniref:Uncharacterized protein n=1 Tax=Thalassolituus oleivorans MIL-1 TaxID=1298593 RepID=M5DRL5_9GAMM|nr:hypothetical protein TOL_1734 [Thalassolituus oleivorans MIL-1]
MIIAHIRYHLYIQIIIFKRVKTKSESSFSYQLFLQITAALTELLSRHFALAPPACGNTSRLLPV